MILKVVETKLLLGPMCILGKIISGCHKLICCGLQQLKRASEVDELAVQKMQTFVCKVDVTCTRVNTLFF
jgi:hypothetical protein